MERLKDLDVDGVAAMLRECQMEEFAEFVLAKDIDGRKLLDVTEGIVKLWRPQVDAKKFLQFVAQLKVQPDKYLKLTATDNAISVENKVEHNIEAQYQTVVGKREREETATSSTVEEILKKIVPPKSFLYRNQQKKAEKNDKSVTSYVPMDAGTPKKPKRFFRLSSYEYPHFDLKQFRLSKIENFNDRGYYSIKSENKVTIPKTYTKPESKPKYKTFSNAEEFEKCSEEHFYEDLNYNEMNKETNDNKEITQPNSRVKPNMSKVQELFSSFKLPFFKRTEDVERDGQLNEKKNDECDKDGHIYENSDSLASMYDSIQVNLQTEANETQAIPVEEYLEPVQLSREYCDVTRAKDDSILGYILNLFENLRRRETTESADQAPEVKTPEHQIEEKPRLSMADRPLPVPVESEPYFMDIDRTEAENLLRGQPDGTFILRPSSQPDHAYTLTVSCSGAVHNIGIRRRADGRLALGFARKGERSFETVTSLLRHHRKQRLLLVAGGAVCGATALVQPPEYYQRPSEIVRPVFQANTARF